MVLPGSSVVWKYLEGFIDIFVRFHVIASHCFNAAQTIPCARVAWPFIQHGAKDSFAFIERRFGLSIAFKATQSHRFILLYVAASRFQVRVLRIQWEYAVQISLRILCQLERIGCPLVIQ